MYKVYRSPLLQRRDTTFELRCIVFFSLSNELVLPVKSTGSNFADLAIAYAKIVSNDSIVVGIKE